MVRGRAITRLADGCVQAVAARAPAGDLLACRESLNLMSPVCAAAHHALGIRVRAWSLTGPGGTHVGAWRGMAGGARAGEGAGAHDHPLDPARVAQARAGMPAADTLTAVAAQLSLTADITRLRVLLALRTAGELCVGDLAMAAGASDDAVGYALRVLRTAGLVSFRKEGRVVYYRLADGFPARLLDDFIVILGRLTPPHGGGPQ